MNDPAVMCGNKRVERFVGYLGINFVAKRNTPDVIAELFGNFSWNKKGGCMTFSGQASLQTFGETVRRAL